MKKLPSWLTIIVVFGLFLSACSPQTPIPSSTAEPDITQPPVASDTPRPTATSTPPPTDTQEPTSTPILPTETATSVPTLAVTEPITGSTRVSDIDQMEQVYVPAGAFIMGSDSDLAKKTIEGGRAYPEIPVHTVTLDGYWIDKYEVSNAQYALCVEAGACELPFVLGSETRPHYYDDPQYGNYPVMWVNWYMAGTYCQWAGRRLPTEAEWEKAARGPNGQEYPWGNEPITGERANFCDINCERTIANGKYDDGYADTAPVDSYPAGVSPYGAMNMAGNLWEWVSSIIMPYPYDPDDGREDQEVYSERVWRGGPWSNGTWWMRSSLRYRSVPTYWWVNLGFRCAASR